MSSDFTSRPLDAGERPRRFYEYFVTGKGNFPTDMLRHDKCWPATGEDAAIVHVTFEDGAMFRKPRTIKLWSYREPTIDRWMSFSWAVSGYRPSAADLANDGRLTPF